MFGSEVMSMLSGSVPEWVILPGVGVNLLPMGYHVYIQGELLKSTPPKFSKYKIPLKLLALREILGQFLWDLVLRKFGGGGRLKRLTL